MTMDELNTTIEDDRLKLMNEIERTYARFPTGEMLVAKFFGVEMKFIYEMR